MADAVHTADSTDQAQLEASKAENRQNLSAVKPDGTPDYTARMQAYEKILAEYNTWNASQPAVEVPEEDLTIDNPETEPKQVHSEGFSQPLQPSKISIFGDVDTELIQEAIESVEDLEKGFERMRLETVESGKGRAMNTPTWLLVKPEDLDPNLPPKDRIYKPNFAQKLQLGGYKYWLWKREQDEAAAAAEAEKSKTKASKGKGKR